MNLLYISVRLGRSVCVECGSVWRRWRDFGGGFSAPVDTGGARKTEAIKAISTPFL